MILYRIDVPLTLVLTCIPLSTPNTAVCPAWTTWVWPRKTRRLLRHLADVFDSYLSASTKCSRFTFPTNEVDEFTPVFERTVLRPRPPGSCADGPFDRHLEPRLASPSAPQQLSAFEHASAGGAKSSARRQRAASSCHRRRWGWSRVVGAEQETRV